MLSWKSFLLFFLLESCVTCYYWTDFTFYIMLFFFFLYVNEYYFKSSFKSKRDLFYAVFNGTDLPWCLLLGLNILFLNIYVFMCFISDCFTWMYGSPHIFFPVLAYFWLCLGCWMEFYRRRFCSEPVLVILNVFFLD